MHTARAGLLDGTRLCRWCARQLTIPGLVVPGSEGTYLALTRYLVAVHDWVTAFEAAAPSADWLACARWNACHPFTDQCPVTKLLAALPADQPWASWAETAEDTWEDICGRAIDAERRARQTAGPPGYRAMAACARALAAASPGTRLESRLLDGSAGLPSSSAAAWTTASAAWLDAIAADGNLSAANAALATTLEDRYADVQVRDVTLLPRPAATDAEFDSPAEWAQAEHEALRREVATVWRERLTDCLASVLSQDHDSGWQLLRVAGWPITSNADRDLAYLGAYPELARIPDPDCGYRCGRGHPSWAVVLHVPRFAAIHATLHDGAHLDITPGPSLPARATPTATQVRALLHGNVGQPAVPRNRATP